jgi:hypothetical protein
MRRNDLNHDWGGLMDFEEIVNLINRSNLPKSRFRQLLSKEQKDERSVARDDDSSTTAGYIITLIAIKQSTFVRNFTCLAIMTVINKLLLLQDAKW